MLYTHLKGMHNSISNNSYKCCSLHHCEQTTGCYIHDFLEPRLLLWITAAYAPPAVLLPEVVLREVPDEPTSSRLEPKRVKTILQNDRTSDRQFIPLWISNENFYKGFVRIGMVVETDDIMKPGWEIRVGDNSL